MGEEKIKVEDKVVDETRCIAQVRINCTFYLSDMNLFIKAIKSFIKTLPEAERDKVQFEISSLKTTYTKETEEERAKLFGKEEEVKKEGEE